MLKEEKCVKLRLSKIERKKFNLLQKSSDLVQKMNHTKFCGKCLHEESVSCVLNWIQYESKFTSWVQNRMFY